jgi:hypothetical protein
MYTTVIEFQGYLLAFVTLPSHVQFDLKLLSSRLGGGSKTAETLIRGLPTEQLYTYPPPDTALVRDGSGRTIDGR